MKVLITGSNGQLGSEIRELSSRFKDFDFIFKDLPDLDICNLGKLENFIHDNQINAVINCAAYTAVDEAEKNKLLAERVNSIGVSNLISALERVDGKLIHISTDYVFDGNQSIPYKETDLVNPIGVYGHTKRAGELAVLNSNLDAIIIRTSWLYSSFGDNFVKKIISLAKEKKSLNIVNDQFGSPTYARDLATVCIKILSEGNKNYISKNGKLYHYSNEGTASWYDFAVAIKNFGDLSCEINSINSDAFNSKAKRPNYSVLNKSKIKNNLKLEIPHWKESLVNCIKKIKI